MKTQNIKLNAGKSVRRAGSVAESGHVPILKIAIDSIRPSPENDALYKPVLPEDPEIVALAASIGKHGVQEPLVITADDFILSGHRRYVAARLAGLRSVPCIRRDIQRADHPNFVALLREYNRQRVKSREEQWREEIVSIDPEQAYRNLLGERERRGRVTSATIDLRATKCRSMISEAKRGFLEAVQGIIERLSDFWPLSDRQIHYQLLNEPPLIHAKKPGSRYRNDLASYKALSDLLTRARHEGSIDYSVIADSTRPFTTWSVWPNPAGYMREQLNGIFHGYYRDLLISQPNHIEIVGEKLTIAGIIRPIAAHFRVPMTIGRGYCSTRPKHDIAERYRKSGKQRLVLLAISDLDPDGEEIAHSLARSLRDDFDIPRIDAIKVALRAEQVRELQLPPSMLRAKRTSSNYARFVRENSSDEVYELEALPPEVLQRLLTEALDNVLDLEAFNAEIRAEREDAAHIEALRLRVIAALRDAGISEGEAPAPQDPS